MVFSPLFAARVNALRLLWLAPLPGMAFLPCRLPAQGQHPPVPCFNGERWSVPYPASSSGAGSFVHIPAGTDVVLDVDTPPLSGLLIEGNLVFDDCYGGDYELNAAYILVTGSLQVGWKDDQGVIHPHSKKATIRLIAPESYVSLNPPGLDPTWKVYWDDITEPALAPFTGTSVQAAAFDRGLVVTKTGKLHLYGKDKGASWTSLRSTAPANAMDITVDGALGAGWVAGNQIVLASTDFEYDLPNSPVLNSYREYRQGEIRTLDYWSGANSIHLSQPLQHTHFGEVVAGPPPYDNPQLYPEWTVAEKGEVGLLTRNVVVEGEESALSRDARAPYDGRHRGHVILLPFGTQTPACEVQWTEFRSLGVEGVLGRYPFHWHLIGAAYSGMDPLPYVEFSSIHDCVNRFLVVHNTQHVRVEGNVGYNTIGSGFYLEDDTEPFDNVRKVELVDNLGLAVNQPVKFYDFPSKIEELEFNEPSVFWIQHPDNKISGNHAAGGFGHGFYLLSSKQVTWTHENGVSYFRDNVAHSNGQSGFYHNGRPEWTYEPGDDPAASGLIAYKNRRYGVWWRTFGVSFLTGLRLADNKSGIYPASEGELSAGRDPVTGRIKGAIIMIDDCTIFGETPGNIGEITNAAEQAAQRSLAQTHMYFTRWEDNAAPHNLPWDVLNAVEAYDGLLRLGLEIRVGFFQNSVLLPDPNPNTNHSPAVRRCAGITQAEYRSPYAEDPRNSMKGWIFAGVQAQHEIHFREPAVTPPLRDNMIRNTVVYDEDGSLPYGSGTYYAYQHPFMIANCTVNPPGFPAPVHHATEQVYEVADVGADYAQVWVKPKDGGWPMTARMVVTVKDFNGNDQVMSLDSAGGGNPNHRFPFNAILGLNKNPVVGQTGVYTCSFPGAATLPTAYEIKIQFCEREDVPTILAVPLVNIPTRLELNDDLGYINNRELDLAALLASTRDHAWAHDPVAGLLYLKTTTQVDPGQSAQWEGTKNFIDVNIP